MTDRGLAGHKAPMAVPCPTLEPPVCADERPAPTFDRVYDEHVDFVWRSLRRLGIDRAELDDAVQDVFIVVHRRLGEFQGRSSLKTWLFGIAYRVVCDRRRTARRKGAHAPLTSCIADRGPDPLERLEAHDELRRLDEALACLDDEKRAVFVMGEIEQMSAPEIALAIGIKLNTVYSRLRAARRELDAALVRAEQEER